jgi:18S rRNA (guanine1575-N7)-methyltransferase
MRHSFVSHLFKSNSSRNQRIQAEMTYRAIELLTLPPDQPLFLLDIGCGSGLSGEILDELGHVWAGVDIAPSMLREWLLLFCPHL